MRDHNTLVRIAEVIAVALGDLGVVHRITPVIAAAILPDQTLDGGTRIAAAITSVIDGDAAAHRPSHAAVFSAGLATLCPHVDPATSLLSAERCLAVALQRPISAVIDERSAMAASQRSVATRVRCAAVQVSRPPSIPPIRRSRRRTLRSGS